MAEPPGRGAWSRWAVRLHGLWLLSRARWERSARNVTRRNTRRAYEKLYAADDLLAEYLGSERLAFYAEVAALAAPYSGRAVVDVGCGTGHLLRALLDRLPAERRPERLLALDHAANAIRRVGEIVPEAEGRVFDILRDDLAAERFDLVLCTEVLEHVRHPGIARDLLGRVCARGGAIVITVPDGALDSWEGHANFWDSDQLAAFLEPLGAAAVQRIDAGRVLLAVVKPDGAVLA